MSALPAAFADVVEEFTSMPPRQRLELLLDYADDLPELPERYASRRDAMEQVHECQSPLFLAVEVAADDTVRLYFDAPAEAPTTRGFAGVLRAGLDGLPASEVQAMPVDAPLQLGLADAVSPLRLRGMVAMLSRIQRQVRERRS